MILGITHIGGRVCPCFQGAGLRVVDADGCMSECSEVFTAGWQELSWPRELMNRDVVVLVCSGIDRFLLGALHGYGIEVLYNVAGTVDEVVAGYGKGKEVRCKRECLEPSLPSQRHVRRVRREGRCCQKRQGNKG